MCTHTIRHLNLDTHTETHAIISKYLRKKFAKQNEIHNQTHI
jgi:hypothetical protein